MIPSLPEADVSASKRQQTIHKAREQFRWNHEYLAPLPLCDDVPKGEKPTLAWAINVAEVLFELLRNGREISLKARKYETRRGPGELSALQQLGKQSGARGILERIQQDVEMGAGDVLATSLADYELLFQEIREPLASKWCYSDHYFSYLRLAGPNPMVIHGIDEIPDNFAVTNRHYQGVMTDGDSLERALAESRLFLCDYAMLDGFECGTFPSGRQKYIAAPLALFAMPRGHYHGRFLVPVAIQLGQKDAAIVTSTDGVAWQIAKSLVNCADGNLHQAVEHLGRTHLIIEPFVIAMHRNLAPSHPLYVLLAPHFEGTLDINNAAHSSLIAPGGGVDVVMSGTIEASRAAVVAGWSSFRFNERFVPRALKERQVEDTTRLPMYPYRDDALLIWEAIEDWVRAYIGVYYADNSAVQGDRELQDWIADVVSPHGGRMQAVGQNGGVETVNYLVDMLTMIIFTAGPQHAAVNFPQLELMSFAPFYPLACFAPVPKRVEDLTHEHWLAFLPPLDIAQYQMYLGNLLGRMHYTTLGQYVKRGLLSFGSYFSDERVHSALDAFQRRLSEIETEIGVRNSLRPRYEYLMPSQIPQSTNI